VDKNDVEAGRSPHGPWDGVGAQLSPGVDKRMECVREVRVAFHVVHRFFAQVPMREASSSGLMLK
jgi:hypothetical protein